VAFSEAKDSAGSSERLSKKRPDLRCIFRRLHNARRHNRHSPRNPTGCDLESRHA
jgi:hypothetical protein